MPFLRPRLTRASRGQSMVEAAIVLPVLILFLLLAIDFGRVFFASIDLRNAAHEATMVGGSNPQATCAEMKAVVDRQMGRTDAVCSPGAPGAATGIVYITQVTCENCGGWSPPYQPGADLRYLVRLGYNFSPVVPLVGLLTGNGLGQPIPLTVENRSPVLKGYVGG